MSLKLKVNKKFLGDLVAQGLKVGKGGAQLQVDDPEAVGQYVFSVLGLAVGLIPVVGAPMSALCDLMGAVLFSPNMLEKIWDGLRERIEKLIDDKIQERHLEDLKTALLGLQNGMNEFTTNVKNYEKAGKTSGGKSVGIAFIALHMTIIEAIPKFMERKDGVASLPLFAIAANIHLTLLATAINYGKGWGFDDNYYTGLTDKFEALSSSSHADSYVVYANNVFEEGRNNVQLDGETVPQPGSADAAKWRAYAAYDTNMIIHVLRYTKIWPHLVTGDVPDEDLAYLDQEVYFGPFGRNIEHTRWSYDHLARIEPRGSPISEVYIRGADSVDYIWTGYEDGTSEACGKKDGGLPQDLKLMSHEYISEISLHHGLKLGSLKIITNQGRSIGVGKHAQQSNWGRVVRPAGYALSSLKATRWELGDTQGINGVVLGFRPLAFCLGLEEDIWTGPKEDEVDEITEVK